MEGFGWDRPEVTGDTSLWNTNTPSGQQSYGYGPASYDVINSIQHQIDLQRAKASLIQSSNSVRLVQSNINQVHLSGVIAPTSSQSANPIPSGCSNFQCSSSNAADSNTKDSFDVLDCLLLATNSNPNGAADEEAGTMSSLVILQDAPSRSFWNFGSGGDIPSGESKKDDTCLHGSNKANAKESTKKRRNNINEGSFQLIGEVDPPKPKRPRFGKGRAEKQNISRTPSSSNISFQLYLGSASPTSSIDQEPDQEAMTQMKEFIYRAAAFRPVNLGLEVVEKLKRKNVRISSDPQTVAARQRRERISDRIRVLQRLVPGGTKMDTASMLDEAANYLKFLQSQIKALEHLGPKIDSSSSTNCLPNINSPIFSSMPFLSHPFNSLQTRHPLPFQSPYLH